MQNLEQLSYSKYYHIYNRGINSCNIFTEMANYSYFLGLYENHISVIADTYAWVLMPNHFHFLVRIKDEDVVLKNQSDSANLAVELKPPHQYFSNLFNAYSKAFNKRNGRHGSLFERPFKRKLADNEKYLKQLVLYIHNNPVHHGFCDLAEQYRWSSYNTYLTTETTSPEHETVLGWFGSVDNYRKMHHTRADISDIEKWLEI